jgi:hypothetical protein
MKENGHNSKPRINSGAEKGKQSCSTIVLRRVTLATIQWLVMNEE